MPEIHLFVVSIASIQQQGMTLTNEIEKIVPTVIQKVMELMEKKMV
jgi:hydrogenase maturation protease